MADDIDCYEVDAVIGLDRDGQELPGEESLPALQCQRAALFRYCTPQPGDLIRPALTLSNRPVSI